MTFKISWQILNHFKLQIAPQKIKIVHSKKYYLHGSFINTKALIVYRILSLFNPQNVYYPYLYSTPNKVLSLLHPTIYLNYKSFQVTEAKIQKSSLKKYLSYIIPGLTSDKSWFWQKLIGKNMQHLSLLYFEFTQHWKR